MTEPPRLPRPSWRAGLKGGLAQRIFLLFLLAALAPLAVSDWLSSAAISQIADNLNLRGRAQATRQTSRQVFDRLMTARGLLAATAQARSGEVDAWPSLSQAFVRAVRLAPDGQVVWSSDATETPLLSDWHHAAPPAPGTRPALSAAPDTDVVLRLTPPGIGQARRMLMGALRRGVLCWVAELRPEHVWAPLTDTSEDSLWQVQDAQGHVLAERRGGDHVSGRVETRTSLFLRGELGADDWIFVQRSPRPQARWQGASLSLWLGGVAMATLLASALLSRWQIRRVLQPLALLTEGTQRLAAGATATRVAVQQDDEIGLLAGAFNHMAGRISVQLDVLQGLAEIDHEILAGTPMAGLAERVVTQLAALFPGARLAVTWWDGEGHWWQAGSSTAPPSDWAGGRSAGRLTPSALAAAQALDPDAHIIDLTRDGAPPAGPWWPTPGPPGADRAVLLPLHSDGGGGAAIALLMPAWPDADAEAEALRPARELRDRLAVAFAARARERELVFRAGHDSLTGLVNRHGLHERLDALTAAQQHAPNTAPALAVLMLDLDHFKDVNDSSGHEAGDELLRQAGERLRAALPSTALLARQGGDEFAVVLTGLDEAAAADLAQTAIQALKPPFSLRSGVHAISASVGVAMAGPPCGAGAASREELLRRADIALYAAKAAGRGRHAMFTTQLDAAAREHARLPAALQQALDRGEFRVHYQPRVRPGDGRITSAEALIRWQHPERGLVYPGDFIERAESSGLIVGIGLWILNEVCAQVAAWRRQGCDLARVSVNVSPRQLVSGELPAQVRAALDRHQLPAEALELEVTESLLVGNASEACAQLETLRRWGVSIALDDFGTGYSSMATLRQLPVDVMKIDRAFVKDLGQDDGAMAITRAIVALAKSLTLHLVAEGIETEAQAELLRSLGCDELQGYLYSRPLPPERFAALPGVVAAEAQGVPAEG